MGLTTKEIVCTVQDLVDTKPINGFMADEHGNLTRLENIRDTEKSKDKLVRELSAQAALVADEINAFKELCINSFDQLISDLESNYNVKLGGKKGNVTLTTYDKRLKITRTRQERMTTNEHMLVVNELVERCLSSWSKGANRNLQAVVRKYFSVDANGEYSISKLRSVRSIKLENPDPDWDKAMEALDNALQFDSTATYFRVFFRTDKGHYIMLPLDIAKA